MQYTAARSLSTMNFLEVICLKLILTALACPILTSMSCNVPLVLALPCSLTRSKRLSCQCSSHLLLERSSRVSSCFAVKYTSVSFHLRDSVLSVALDGLETEALSCSLPTRSRDVVFALFVGAADLSVPTINLCWCSSWQLDPAKNFRPFLLACSLRC